MAVRLADKIKQSNDADFFLVDAADVEMLDGSDLETKIASIEAGSSLNMQIVESLPTTGISTTTIYMILREDGEVPNLYDEYIYVNNNWELIGTSAVDLTDYYTKSETSSLIDSKISTARDIATTEIAGVVKPDGSTISVTNDGTISALASVKYKNAVIDVPSLEGFPELPEAAKGKHFLILKARTSNKYVLITSKEKEVI